MPDTNRYVRVDGIVSRGGDFKERDGHVWWWQPSRQDWIGLGDVIELTEALTFGTNDDGIDRPRFRLWVEPLGPVDV